MNIIDAVKSGRPLRRINKTTWQDKNSNTQYYGGENKFICPVFLLNTIIINPNDIIADDWEIEEERKEFSKREIEIAINLVNESNNHRIEWKSQLFDKLGFKE